MHTYFNGRMLSAESFTTEQTYVNHHRSLGKAAALEPPPPRGSHEALIASLPPSILDEVALNPQPLPPREATQPAPADTGCDGSELEMVRLQSMLSDRQQFISLTTALVKALNDTTAAIAGNVGK